MRASLPLLLIAWLALAGSAAAQPPAPEFLPGQPLVVGTQVLMMWNPVPGASGYVVYRNEELLARVAANQYLGPLPEISGKYRFQVSAVDAAGIEGPRSQPGTVQVRALTPPKGLVAQADPSAGDVSLLWNRVEGAAFYNIYRSGGGKDRQLLASVSTENHVDRLVEAGTEYTYVVTARDVTGSESPASDAVKATPAKKAPPTAREKAGLRARPTREVASVDQFDNRPIDKVTHLRIGPRGNLWVVTPTAGAIRVLDPSGIPVAVLGPYTFSGTGFSLVPHKIDFGPDGNVYVSDYKNATLACLSPAGELVWARGVLAPPPSERELWEGFPAAVKTRQPTPSSVMCLPDEVWVTDQRFQIVYRFNYQGDLLGFLSHVKRGGKPARLPVIGELLDLGKEGILVTLPLSHKAWIVDRELNVRAEIGGGRGLLGGFVGIHGAARWGGREIFLTDPAVASVQAFDLATGDYLYHLSGAEPRPDPKRRYRADFPVRNPMLAAADGTGGKLWLFDGYERRLLALAMTGDALPVAP